MMYFIERFNAHDIPFQDSIESCVLSNKIYDIIESNKDSKLETISEHIIDDNHTFRKTNPRESVYIVEIMLARFGIKMNEILLG